MLNPGQIALDRYVVEHKLGEGGMGQVYQARHVRLGSPVALKVLFPQAAPGLAERFEREAALMARVRHPNVVSILDFGLVEESSPCIAMEFLEGESLEQRVERRGASALPLEVQQLLERLSGVAEKCWGPAAASVRSRAPLVALSAPRAGPPRGASAKIQRSVSLGSCTSAP